jgi:hypothetical protein
MKPGIDVTRDIGEIQSLNTRGMVNYGIPKMRIFYDIGYPTIGNGRRTNIDFLFKAHSHWTTANLTSMMLSSKIGAIGDSILNAAVYPSDEHMLRT